MLALALERKFSKDQILELYLNRVYFGGGAYGIDAASRDASSAMAPNGCAWARRRSSPAWSRRRPTIRRPPTSRPRAAAPASCCNSMVENGFVRAGRGGRGRSGRRSGSSRPAKQNSVRYFTDWALPQLDTLIDETSEPIDVWTTLDPGMQARRRPGDRRPTRPPARRARWWRIDRDGAVRAMVGGRDYVDSIYNRATQAERQPGSAFKLFVYLSALESGMKPTDTIVDEPVTIDGWTPAQLDPHQRRARSRLREAFSRSINTISAKIGDPARLRRPSPTWRAGSASAARSRPSRRWCWEPATSG